MIYRRAFLQILFAAIAVIFTANPAFSGPVYTVEGAIAIDGHDPVAYFTESKPVKGEKKHKLQYNGAIWHFASAENRETFKADPKKYEPQYGGFCAYAMAQGYKAPTVPESWRVIDGKLYLNYSIGVRDLWEKKRASYIKSADKHWSKY